jgi:hypothetical protein
VKTRWDIFATKIQSHKGLNLSILGVLVSLWLIIPAILLGADFEPQGFVDTYHAVRYSDPNDYLSSRIRLRLEMWMSGENASLFASMNAIHNNVITSNSGLELREAYMDYQAEKWDIRIGRQIIVWGKADGVQITDVISPMDLTEFLARDYDDIRMPVDALKFRYLREHTNFEFIWVPVFQAAIIPSGNNPWAVKTEFPADLNVTYENPLIPEKKFKNSEIGGKISFYLPGIDLALSSLYTWDKFPVMNQTRIDDNNLSIRAEHHRLTFVGLEFSLPCHEFVLRGEAAYYKGKYLEPATLDDRLMQKNTINWLLGLDWYPGGNWSLSAQFADNFILDYDKKINNDKHNMISTLSISKKLLRETLTLSSFAYIGINNQDIFDRSSIDYALTDELHLSIGFDIFIGDEGMFGQFKDNNEVWVKAKYSF